MKEIKVQSKNEWIQKPIKIKHGFKRYLKSFICHATEKKQWFFLAIPP